MSNPSQPGRQHRYRRRRITWPVTVQADARRLHGETLDVGPQGAKLRLTERPDVGTCITLHLMPSDGHPMAIRARVSWVLSWPSGVRNWAISLRAFSVSDQPG